MCMRAFVHCSLTQVLQWINLHQTEFYSINGQGYKSAVAVAMGGECVIWEHM